MTFRGAGPPGPPGPEGPEGPQGPQGPPTWRGTWDSGTDYNVDDAVEHNGSSWFAATDPAVGDEPGVASAWELMADQGADGADGTPINWRGTWDSGVAYNYLDAVAHSAESWIANQDTNAGDEPGVSAKWDKMTDGITESFADDTYARVVEHATDSTVARPTARLVLWIGTVQPDNAASGDVLYDRSNDLWQRWDGSAWVDTGGTTYVGKGDLVVDVTDHGAVGDGTTDSTTAVESARDELIAAGGGILFYPAGHFRQGPVSIHSDDAPIAVEGAGMGATLVTLIDSAADGGVFDFDESTVDVGAHDMMISDMEIDGNKANQDGSGGHVGIRVVRVTRFVAERVHVHHCNGYNIGLVGATHPNRADQTVRDAWLHDGDYDGIDLKSGDEDAGENTLRRPVLERVVSYDNGGGSDGTRAANGIDVRGTDAILRDCHAWGNASNQIVLRSMLFRYEASNCYADGVDDTNVGVNVTGREGDLNNVRAKNADDGIRILADDVTANNCRGEECGSNGLRIDGARAVVNGGKYRGNAANGVQIVDAGAIDWQLVGVDIGGNDRGIRWTNSPGKGIYVACNLQNTSGATIGTEPTGTQSAANLT